MPGLPLTLTVQLHPSQLDGRRGVVRLHPEVVAALGIRPWSVVYVHGGRLTAALVALSGHRNERDVILMDDLLCANANVVPGQPVTVGPALAAPATTVRLSGGPAHGLNLNPNALRFALLGKVLMAGDHVSLLPQDFARSEGPGDIAVTQLLSVLSGALGEEWKSILLNVDAVEPADLVQVSMETAVVWEGAGSTTTSSTPMATAPARGPAPDSLPGLESQLAELRERLDLGFHRTDLLTQLGTKPQLGVLITGPPGSGKVALVEAASASVGARVVRVWGPALARVEPQQAFDELKRALTDIEAAPPGVLLIEDVDAIAPREQQGPLVSAVLELVDRIVKNGRNAIICTTAHPETTCPDLRRPGLLEMEIQIPSPQREERQRILEVHTRGLALAPDVNMPDVAARTPSFVGADLMALCREAALRAAHRIQHSGAPDAPMSVTQADFDAALEVIRPSSVDTTAVDLGGTTLEDVGDMVEVKKVLTETVVWPLSYPDTFARLGVEPARGVLLYGPPGCGKTFLVRALAASAQANFFSVKGAELLSKWVGESEAAVRDLFRRARAASPCLLFFDEVDALAPVRGGSTDGGATDRVVASLLTELDGIEKLTNVFIVAATNRPELVDPALLRPGRLDRLVYVPPPDAAARADILRAAAKAVPSAPDVDLVAIATGCEGYSAADLAGLVREAAMAAMRENMQSPQVGAAHFAAARSVVRPSLDPKQLASLEAFADGRRV